MVQFLPVGVLIALLIFLALISIFGTGIFSFVGFT
jgi:hypothetical protein